MKSNYIGENSLGEIILEKNIGQLSDDIKYLARTCSGELQIMADRINVATLNNAVENTLQNSAAVAEGVVLTLNFLNSKSEIFIEEGYANTAKLHYISGSDKSKWNVGVPTFTQLKYIDVWHGIDLEILSLKDGLKMNWVLELPQYVSDISLQWEGADEVFIDTEGGMIVKHAMTELRDTPPNAWQLVGGQQVDVECAFILKENGEFGFVINGNYDENLPLIIDPLIPYSTYLGGNEYNFGNDVKVNTVGEAYVVGQTTSVDFPTTPGSFQVALTGESSGFVSKFSADGSELVFSTFLGGSTNNDINSFELDEDGFIYLGGTTFSPDFPVTSGAYQTTIPALSSCFLTKMTPDGADLVYSTFVGGAGGDNFLTDIAVDSQKCMYATGMTTSQSFPVTSGAFQGINPSVDPYDSTAFVLKLEQDGSTLGYSSYLGGNTTDYGECITLDLQSNAYITGYTHSNTFPITAGAFQTTMPGLRTGFVSKVNAQGTTLAYSTYLGGGIWLLRERR